MKLFLPYHLNTSTHIHCTIGLTCTVRELLEQPTDQLNTLPLILLLLSLVLVTTQFVIFGSVRRRHRDQTICVPFQCLGFSVVIVGFLLRHARL